MNTESKSKAPKRGVVVGAAATVADPSFTDDAVAGDAVNAESGDSGGGEFENTDSSDGDADTGTGDNLPQAGVSEEKRVEAEALAEEVVECKKTLEENYLKMADLLRRFYDDALYIAIGFDSFGDFVEEKLDIGKRKALYLVDISRWLAKLPPHMRDWIASIGWTKAKELTGKVTEDNYESWRARLEGKSYSEMMKMIEADAGGGAEAAEKKKKGESGNNVNGPRKVSFSLFAEQDETITAALNKAKSLANTDKDSVALDAMATEFLASNGGFSDTNEYLARVEVITGLKIVAIQVADGEPTVVFGGDSLDTLFPPEESNSTAGA